MTESPLLYETDRGVAYLTLNRPAKLNAIDQPLLAAIGAALDRAESDDEVRVVVLRGAGRAFSAGYDLAEEVEMAITTTHAWHDLLAKDVAGTMRLWSFPKPTIASVHGYCLAGGLELAIACDMVVAADDTVLGAPEIRYGSGPVTLLLPFVLGNKKANELLYTGDTVSAVEAERIGLVNRVVAVDDLREETARLAARIAPTPLPVLRLTKQALLRAQEAMGLREAVAANLDLSAMLNSADTEEQREFDRIVRDDGLRAALAWRDSRYGAISGSSPK